MNPLDLVICQSVMVMNLCRMLVSLRSFRILLTPLTYVPVGEPHHSRSIR